MNGHSFLKCGAQGLNLCALLNRTTNQNTQFCAFVELRNNNGGLLEL